MREIDLTSYDSVSHFAIAVGIVSAIDTVAVFIAGIVASVMYFWWLFIPVYVVGGGLIALQYTGGMLIASYVSHIWEIKKVLKANSATNQTQQPDIFNNVKNNNRTEKKTTVVASKTPVATSKTPVNSSNAPTAIVKTTIECPSCFAQNDIHAQRCKECGCPLK